MAAKKKKVAKKVTKKVAKKVAKKKVSSKKPAPRKLVKKKAAAKKPARPSTPPGMNGAQSLPQVSFDFTAEIAAFCELVNSGGAGEADLEGYASFNEQYKPSDWAQNPALDQQLLTFAMDGAGGQFTLWRQPGKPLLENPVVQLGDDGELHVLANDFASFVALVAEGVNLFSRDTDDLTPRPQVKEFVKQTWGTRDFGDAGSILATASTAWSNFEEWMRAQVKS